MNINPKPGDLLDILYISFALFENTFNINHAKAISGHSVIVQVTDSGRTARYEGDITPVNEKITKIGEEQILNECIVAVRRRTFH